MGRTSAGRGSRGHTTEFGLFRRGSAPRIARRQHRRSARQTWPPRRRPPPASGRRDSSGSGYARSAGSRIDALGVEMAYSGPCVAAPAGRLSRPERAPAGHQWRIWPLYISQGKRDCGTGRIRNLPVPPLGLLTPVMRRRGVGRVVTAASRLGKGPGTLLLHFGPERACPSSGAAIRSQGTDDGGRSRRACRWQAGARSGSCRRARRWHRSQRRRRRQSMPELAR